MRALLHALRCLVVLGLLLPASARAPGDAGGRFDAAWSGAGPRCADVAGESRLCARAVASATDPEDSPSGSGPARAGAAERATAPRPHAPLALLDACASGAPGLAQAFLRVNGSANAHGARA
jgi:hypothetical protein